MPVRRVYIPKPGGKQRPLGIPVILDRVHQARVVNALEPEWEARFEPKSYGFRPGRGCHDAIEAIFQVAKGKNPEAHCGSRRGLAGALEPSSHCQRFMGVVSNRAVSAVGPVFAGLFGVRCGRGGLAVAALDTLQHGLAGDAEDRIASTIGT